MSVMPAEPNEPFYIARVLLMWEDTNGDQYFHAHWFSRGGETVLGETNDPHELFLVDSCADTLLSAVTGKVSVELKTCLSDWHMIGGQDEPEEEMIDQEDGSNFFFQKWYDQDAARFEDPPPEYLAVPNGACYICAKNKCKVSYEKFELAVISTRCLAAWAGVGWCGGTGHFQQSYRV